MGGAQNEEKGLRIEIVSGGGELWQEKILNDKREEINTTFESKQVLLN